MTSFNCRILGYNLWNNRIQEKEIQQRKKAFFFSFRKYERIDDKNKHIIYVYLEEENTLLSFFFFCEKKN